MSCGAIVRFTSSTRSSASNAALSVGPPSACTSATSSSASALARSTCVDVDRIAGSPCTGASFVVIRNPAPDSNKGNVGSMLPDAVTTPMRWPGLLGARYRSAWAVVDPTMITSALRRRAASTAVSAGLPSAPEVPPAEVVPSTLVIMQSSTQGRSTGRGRRSDPYRSAGLMSTSGEGKRRRTPRLKQLSTLSTPKPVDRGVDGGQAAGYPWVSHRESTGKFTGFPSFSPQASVSRVTHARTFAAGAAADGAAPHLRAPREASSWDLGPEPAPPPWTFRQVRALEVRPGGFPSQGSNQVLTRL